MGGQQAQATWTVAAVWLGLCVLVFAGATELRGVQIQYTTPEELLECIPNETDVFILACNELLLAQCAAFLRAQPERARPPGVLFPLAYLQSPELDAKRFVRAYHAASFPAVERLWLYPLLNYGSSADVRDLQIYLTTLKAELTSRNYTNVVVSMASDEHYMNTSFGDQDVYEACDECSLWWHLEFIFLQNHTPTFETYHPFNGFPSTAVPVVTTNVYICNDLAVGQLVARNLSSAGMGYHPDSGAAGDTGSGTAAGSNSSAGKSPWLSVVLPSVCGLGALAVCVGAGFFMVDRRRNRRGVRQPQYDVLGDGNVSLDDVSRSASSTDEEDMDG